MIGFSYTYSDLGEVRALMTPLSQYGIIEYSILFLLLLFSVGLVFFLLPRAYSVFKYLEKQQQKRTRKNLLKQIALQKDIEDSIESEVT